MRSFYKLKRAQDPLRKKFGEPKVVPRLICSAKNGLYVLAKKKVAVKLISELRF